MTRTPNPTRFVVLARSEVWSTQKGNLYLECDTDHGTVAFWGKAGNTRNIDAIEAHALPLVVNCDSIASRWPQHRLWIMEGTRLNLSATEPQPATLPPPPPGTVSPDELNQWRRRLLRLIDQLFGKAPEQGPISRITGLKRDGRIPRKIAALMIAITEVRNAAEHPAEMPTPSEAAAARAGWNAVKEWAASQGVDADSL